MDQAPLNPLEVGAYADLISRPNPERLMMQFVPALAAILMSAERNKGEPLTREEVQAIRDEATVMVVPRSAAAAVEDSRQYKDIDPENGWQEWQRLRTQVSAK